VLVTHNPELANQTEVQFRLGGGKLQQKTVASKEIVPSVKEPEIDMAQDQKPVEITQSTPAKVVILETGFCQAKATNIIHEVRPDLGLFDLPGILNALPFTVLNGVEREKAEELKNRFEDAGCVVELVNTSELK